MKKKKEVTYEVLNISTKTMAVDQLAGGGDNNHFMTNSFQPSFCVMNKRHGSSCCVNMTTDSHNLSLKLICLFFRRLTFFRQSPQTLSIPFSVVESTWCWRIQGGGSTMMSAEREPITVSEGGQVRGLLKPRAHWRL